MNSVPIFTALRVWPLSDRARYRWSVASRALAAVVGGYAVTSLFNLAFSLLLGAIGVNVPQALLGTTMASFLLYAAIIMAVFHVSSAARAWAGLAGAAVPLAIITLLLWPGVGA
jgi:Zn-dependent membrane protease YugP